MIETKIDAKGEKVYYRKGEKNVGSVPLDFVMEMIMDEFRAKLRLGDEVRKTIEWEKVEWNIRYKLSGIMRDFGVPFHTKVEKPWKRPYEDNPFKRPPKRSMKFTLDLEEDQSRASWQRT